MYPTIRISLIVALFTIYFSAFAQPLKVFDGNDALPQSFVSGLIQDSTGFIWIATRNGLARYDGVNFKTYRHNNADPKTIASNLLVNIIRDKRQKIWIEYDSGAIDELNPQSVQVTHCAMVNTLVKSSKYMRRGWVMDSENYFWAITNTQQIKRIHNNQTIQTYLSLPGDTLMGITEDIKAKIWVVSHHYISVFDKQTNQFVRVPIPYQQFYNQHFESGGRVIDIHQRANGELMWGDRKCLFFFNPMNHAFRAIHLPKFYKMGVKWIRSGPDQNEYFEIEGDFYRYDTKGLTCIAKATPEPFDIQSMLVDQSGLIWAGTNAKGIYQLDLNAPHFEALIDTTGFPQDLLRKEFNISVKKVFNWTEQDERRLHAGYHFRSFYDRHKRLWMSLKNTICNYKPELGEMNTLPPVPLTSDKLDFDPIIQGISVDQGNNLWTIGTNAQILFYNQAQEKWIMFFPAGYLKKIYGKTLLPQDLLCDGNNLWITTESHGLLIINILSKKIIQLQQLNGVGHLPTNQLLQFLPDSKNSNMLWIGSYDGLIHLNKKTLKCDVFSLEQGLPDNTIYSVLADRNGFLWLTTNKGLCCFNPANGKVRVFQRPYGLPGNEYNRFHHLNLPDGRMAFGGPYGWTLFDPLQIKKDHYQPKAAFTDIWINNKTHLNFPLNNSSPVVLSYENNTLAVSFTGLEFNLPKELLYRYRLIGYDHDWISAGHTAVANYTKLPPGNYALEVNASNTTGEWSRSLRRIKIIVIPPWWNRGWVQLVYLIAAVCLLWMYIRYRINNWRLQYEVYLKESEAKQLRELDQIRNKFYANITHEFRTPLSLILGPAEQLSTADTNPALRADLVTTIKQNTKHLLVLINQLLDFAKLEAKALKPIIRIGSPSNVVHSVLASYFIEIQEHQIDLKFIDHTADCLFWFDNVMLETIIYNMVSNAIKYTPAAGSIKLQLYQEETGIRLIIEDTGSGIPADKIPFIFDRFYQADDLVSQTGSGIGLALVKELIHLQSGSITVKSKVGATISGTVFTIKLPYQKVDSAETKPYTDASTPIAPPNEYIERGDRRQILLVENNNELATYLAHNLVDKYVVFRANNGNEGVNIATEYMPDLIISDVVMPVTDGFELCRKLKEDVRTSHIPVILLSAKTAQEDRLKGLLYGADVYLTKPFHIEELRLRVENLIQRQSILTEHINRELASPLPNTSVRQPDLEDEFILHLYELIEGHLDNPLFNVEELVELTGVSRTSLHRKVKALSGFSTSELIRNYKLKRAATLLLMGESSSVVANRTGFSSPAYFSKCFRELYNLTPGEFVRQNKR